MVVIRLRPKGKKKQKTYRVVVDDKKNSLQGKNIEDLGWLDRHSDEFKINKERAEYWLSVGAQPSDTVYNLFVTAGIIEGKKRPVHSTRKRGKEESESSDESPEENSTDEKKSEPEEDKAEPESEEPSKDETEDEKEDDNPEEESDKEDDSNQEESEEESSEKETEDKN